MTHGTSARVALVAGAAPVLLDDLAVARTTQRSAPSSSPSSSVPVLRARGLVRSYGTLRALAGLDLSVRAGEVLAVVGSQGAGKSTLVRVLAGVEPLDAGAVLIDGQEVRLAGARDAQAHGIEVVHQQLSLTPTLDIAGNVFLGRELRRPGLLGSVLRQMDHATMRAEAARLMAELGVRVKNLDQQVGTLSGGQRQAVAVARAAYFARRVVVMDDPTAALGVRESAQVLQTVRAIRARGQSVVMVGSHLPHVFAVADRIHVQHRGRRVAVVDPRERTPEEVSAMANGWLEPTAQERSAD